MKKIILIKGILFCSIIALGQQTYYEMPNKKIIDQNTYENVKENLAKNGKLEEVIISKIIRNDSIIITPKFNVLTQKDENGNFTDPYAEQKKLIGSHFPIEIFKNNNGRKYKSNALQGKPTFVNFWFTNCTPCVAEIPTLNKLQDSLQTKVNFFAITFDNSKKVEKFMQKRILNYNHIVNAKEEIKQLKINAYPTNLILNKKGIIIDVYGEINNSEKIILQTLTKLLL